MANSFSLVFSIFLVVVETVIRLELVFLISGGLLHVVANLHRGIYFWWHGHSISWEFSHPSPGACLGKGATHPGIGAGVGEQPERALLVAEWAHDGVIGFADLLAGEEGVERSKGE